MTIGRSIRVIALLACMAFAATSDAGFDATQMVADAHSQVGVTTGYDPAYQKLSYPGGDVPLKTGVCCDVVIRALRKQGMDLQQLVHNDMKDNFNQYPKTWGLKTPDTNIDHRRVPNLACYFSRQGWSVAVSTNASAYMPGDIVTWDLGKGLTHIGIVSDRKSEVGIPIIIHNIGNGAQEEDILFKYKITGHYHIKEPATTHAAGRAGKAL